MLPQSCAKTSSKGSSPGQRGAFWEVILATTPRFPTTQTGFSGSSVPTELSVVLLPLTSEQDGNLAARSFLFLPFSWLLLFFLSPSLNDYQRTWAGYYSHKRDNFSLLPSSPPTSYLPAVVFPDFSGAVLRPPPSRQHVGPRNVTVRLWAPRWCLL